MHKLKVLQLVARIVGRLEVFDLFLGTVNFVSPQQALSP